MVYQLKVKYYILIINKPLLKMVKQMTGILVYYNFEVEVRKRLNNLPDLP